MKVNGLVALLLGAIVLGVSPAAAVAQTRVSTVPDVELQLTAEDLVPALDHVASHYPGEISTFDSDTNSYIKALKLVILKYERHHSRSQIHAAAVLFVPPHGYMAFRTNTSEHLDWLTDAAMFGQPRFTTIRQGFYGHEETYRIFSVPLTIPRAYRADRYQGSLAVYTVTKQK